MIPYIIGTTGHRNLVPGDVPGIEAQIRQVLADIRQRLPNTRLIVLSSIAEGADRLTAQTALKLGWELWCVLPTSAAEYEKDFTSEESRVEFRQLLARAVRVVNASELSGHEPDAADRPQIYVDAGDELCRLSHAILAVWDGQASNGPGGTAEVVRSFLTGQFPGASRSGVSFPDCGSVFHVSVRGVADADPRHGVAQLLPHTSDDSAKPLFQGRQSEVRRSIEEGLEALDRFNRLASEEPPEPAIAASQVLPAGTAWQEDPLLSQWLSIYNRAEKTSAQANRRRERSLILVVLLFAVFMLFSMIYGGIVTEVWPLWAGMGSLGVAFALYWWHRRAGVDEAWAGARALTEFLRVRIMWRSSGVNDDIHFSVADEHITPIDWLGIATRWIDNEARLQPPSFPTNEETRCTIATHWINGQLDYFSDRQNKIAHHRRRANRLALASTVCVALALLAYVVSVLLDYVLSPQGREHALQVTAWSMFGFWALLSFAAVVAAYSGIKAHAEHESEYSSSLLKFRLARAAMQRSTDSAQVALLAGLGRAAIRETAGWLRLHRGRPLRLPF